MQNQSDMRDHITFCAPGNHIMDRGAEAERRTAGYIYDNFQRKEWKVGDYRILVNYNLPMRGNDSREIDLVVINRFGVFLIEVKSWLGTIDAYDDSWIVEGTIKRGNAAESINSKARIFRNQFFGSQGLLSDLNNVSVTGLVVLTERASDFHNYSSTDARGILRLDQALLHAVSSTDLLFRGTRSRLLSDQEIDEVYEVVYGCHQARRDELIEHYLVLDKLRDGDLFEEYVAQNVNVMNQRVRVKRYKLQKLSVSAVHLAFTVRQFKRSVEVVSALGGDHPNIVNTINFFPDEKRPDIYFEITELVNGKRLDEMMAETRKALSLKEQLDYIEPICSALQHAHNHQENGEKSPILHRNVSPETVFVTATQVVKLADFDFAKYGAHSISKPGETLVNKPFTAPEVLELASQATPASDIYSLGVLWYFLALLPADNEHIRFSAKKAPEIINALSLPEAARTLMKQMIATIPAQRPQSIEEVLSAIKQVRAAM